MVPTSGKPVYTWHNYINSSNNNYNDKLIQFYYTDILIICLGSSLVQYKSINNLLDLSTDIKSVCAAARIASTANDVQGKSWWKVQNYLRRKK